MVMSCNCSGHRRHDSCKTPTIKRSSRRRSKVSSSSKSKRTLQEQLINTNIDIVLLGILLALYNTSAASQLFDNEDTTVDSTPLALMSEEDELYYNDDTDDENNNPVYAILFPFFTQTLAIIIYYLISRYIKILPYTALVFLLGTIIGYVTNNNQENDLAKSVNIWLGINGQVILLVFLPGLIFNDSFTINVHLFFQAFWQLIIFAFPMVLGGTSLTALVAGYILPYGWTTSLCMSFGAMLSGTDPVAVQSLLNSAGAPHRLNMHISGESLLNDGSVVVLSNIFSSLYFYELGIPAGFGTFSVGEGFAYFFRLSLGGCAIGFAFGVVTVLMLKFLNRRLADEENVVQVVLTVSSAYLSYFTSEIICLCSGIMATIACGITVKVLGETFINDYMLTLHFWQVTAELLNTLLFVLGGCLWGDLLSKDTFSATVEDWGYLALLFVILIAIRFLLVFGLYPLTSRIGIGTNVKESIFMSYGGFRGSVGIALALSLSAQVYNNTDDEETRNNTDQMFFLVGGISVFTLLINGTTAGPLLSALGLAATEKTRQAVLENYKQQMVQNALQSYVRLLSQERWKGIDHSVIQAHVPYLDSFSFEELMIAVERHKNATPVNLYVKPQLALIFPYLQGDQIENGAIMSLRSKSFEQMFKSQSYERLVTLERSGPSPSPARHRMKSEKSLNQLFGHMADTAKGLDDTENIEADDIDEIRLNYIEILRSCYYHQIENGSLEEYGDLTYSLFQGLDFCEHRGQPLNDWEATRMASDTRVVLANRIFVMTLRRLKQLWRRERKCCRGFDFLDPVNFRIRFLVRQNLAFVRAHRHAQQIFQDRFLRVYGKLSSAEAQIIQESQAQIRKAEADVNDIDQEDVLSVKGHLLSLILLNNSIQYVERLSRQKLIPEAQASELLEVLDGLVEDTWVCEQLAHSGRLSTSTQIIRLQQLPTHIMEEFNIWEAIDEMNKTSSSPGGLRDSKMLFQGSTPPRMKMKRSPSHSRSVFHSKWEIETASQTVDTAPTESERTAPMDSERTNNSVVDDAPSAIGDMGNNIQQSAALPRVPTLGDLIQQSENMDNSSDVPTF